MITLTLSEADVGRLRALVRARQNKLTKALEKFAGDWDPEKGANIQASAVAFERLANALDNPRSPRRDQGEYERRWIAPGDNRSSRK